MLAGYPTLLYTYDTGIRPDIRQAYEVGIRPDTEYKKGRSSGASLLQDTRFSKDKSNWADEYNE